MATPCRWRHEPLRMVSIVSASNPQRAMYKRPEKFWTNRRSKWHSHRASSDHRPENLPKRKHFHAAHGQKLQPTERARRATVEHASEFQHLLRGTKAVWFC